MVPVMCAAVQTPADTATAVRNPGPAWGFAFLQWCDRRLPSWIFGGAVQLGAAVAALAMPGQRRHSAEYLAVVLGRRPRFGEVAAHFDTFARALLTKLRAGGGTLHRCTIAPANEAGFLALARDPAPALYGTFHCGNSDLLGFLLSDFRKRVAIVRLQVGNSRDTRDLGRRYGEFVEFLWVNNPANLPFALKDALARGLSVALKCDRVGHSAKLEPFEFLGARRLFPFTIYHLSMVFGAPVVHCLGEPAGRDTTLVHASPVFRPTGDRRADLAAARDHFQAHLHEVEALLRRRPQLWFNFVPLNPAAP